MATLSTQPARRGPLETNHFSVDAIDATINITSPYSQGTAAL